MAGLVPAIYETPAKLSRFLVDARPKAGHERVGASRAIILERLALALLGPEGGLARVAVLRAGACRWKNRFHATVIS